MDDGGSVGDNHVININWVCSGGDRTVISVVKLSLMERIKVLFTGTVRVRSVIKQITQQPTGK